MRRNYFDWLVIALTLLVFAGGLIYLLYNWDNIPPAVPVHFNAYGGIDEFGDKTSIFTIVILEAILVGTIFATVFLPKFWDNPSGNSTPLVMASVRIALELLGFVFATFFTSLYIIMSQAITIPAWSFTVFFGTIVALSFMPFPFAIIARLIKKK